MIPSILNVTVFIRVDSGLNDPDNLGHLGYFFGGSSGSYPQTKLSGCDPDITCSLENSVNSYLVCKCMSELWV